MKYYINYHTGAGDEWVEGSLDEAKRIADGGAAYTQEPITIEDENGVEVACRPWWGIDFRPDETDESWDEIISFGSFGHYGAWYTA